MTGALDARARANAKRLIAKYGKTATWLVDVDTFNVSESENSTATTEYTIAITPPKKLESMVSGSTIETVTVAFAIAALDCPFVPEIGHRVVIDGFAYDVMDVDPTGSGELIAKWDVTCRR